MVAVVTFLLLVVAIAILVRSSIAQRGRAGDWREPRCGRCGYIVRGIPTFVCPECGSDVREVGITTGKTSHSPWIAFLLGALVWSIILPFVASLVVQAIDAAMPRWGTAAHTVTL